MTNRALRTPAARFVATAAIAVVLMPLAACSGDESGEQRTDDVSTIGSTTEGDVIRFVERFMRARQAGLPVDELLSATAAAQYEEHQTGLWLHDDSLPGGPGGEYRRFSTDVESNASEADWKVEVRIRIGWDGDAAPSEIAELLSVGVDSQGALVVLNARRNDDPGDDGLPQAVAETREAIYRAAVGHDYKALRSLLVPETFSYSLGEEGDPIGYWRRQERNEIPILGDVLPSVLHTRFGKTEDNFVWPSATAKLVSDWTEADFESMREAGYTEADIRAFEEQVGGYAGWRVGIRADGTWLYFISGD